MSELELRSADIRQRYKHHTRHRPMTIVGRLVTFVLGILFCGLIITFKSGLKLIGEAFKPSKPPVDDGFADRAVAVMGAFITGSPELFAEDNAPFQQFAARYLLPADGDDSGKPSLAEVAHTILNPPETLSAQTQAALTVIAHDTEHQPGLRRPIPIEITGGRPFFAVDVDLHVAVLIKKRLHLEMPFHPFFVDLADNGKVVPLPYWIAFGREEPAWAHWAPR